jgi:hypothetical protein
MIVTRHELPTKIQILSRALNKEMPEKTNYWFGKFLKLLDATQNKITKERDKKVKDGSRKDPKTGAPIILDRCICPACGPLEKGKTFIECPTCKGTAVTKQKEYDLVDEDATNAAVNAFMDAEIEIDLKEFPFPFPYTAEHFELRGVMITFNPATEMRYLADEFITLPLRAVKH